jgi:hypothetical protein
MESNPAQLNEIIHIEGNTLTVKVGEYSLTLKIEGPKAKPSGRLQMEKGQTMFDLVLEAARTFVKEIGESEFTAADLYHMAQEKHPDLDIKRNSWNSHVMSSAPDHPSSKHYTSHRNYFRYLGAGKYTLEVKESARNTSSR